MGKYVTKCSRGVGELAVMEATQVVGVRTRAKTLALAAAGSGSPKRRKPPPPPQQVVQTSTYLQLRSRRLFMTGRRDRPQQANSSAASSPGPVTEAVSRCSSDASSEVMVDEQESEGLESSRCNFECNRRRETTPSSEARREAGDLESTAGARSSSRPTETAPSEAEIEEFFDAAERVQARRFADKYNYDIVNDVPLDGRFEWIGINL